jgi:hypothetical protein
MIVNGYLAISLYPPISRYAIVANEASALIFHHYSRFVIAILPFIPFLQYSKLNNIFLSKRYSIYYGA